MKIRLILAIFYLSTTIVTIKHKLKKTLKEDPPAPADRTPGKLPDDVNKAGKKSTPIEPAAAGVKGYLRVGSSSF